MIKNKRFGFHIVLIQSMGIMKDMFPFLLSHRKLTCSVDTLQTAGLWLKKNNLNTHTCQIQ